MSRTVEFANGRLSVELDSTEFPSIIASEIDRAQGAVTRRIQSADIPGFAYAPPAVYELIHPQKPNAFIDLRHNLVWVSDHTFTRERPTDMSATTVLIHEIVHRNTVGISDGQITNIGLARLAPTMSTEHQLPAGQWHVVGYAEGQEIGAVAGFRNAPFDPQDLKYTEVMTDFVSFLISPEHAVFVTTDSGQPVLVIDNLAVEGMLRSAGCMDLPGRIVEALHDADENAIERSLYRVITSSPNRNAGALFSLLRHLLSREIISRPSIDTIFVPAQALARSPRG